MIEIVGFRSTKNARNGRFFWFDEYIPALLEFMIGLKQWGTYSLTYLPYILAADILSISIIWLPKNITNKGAYHILLFPENNTI